MDIVELVDLLVSLRLEYNKRVIRPEEVTSIIDNITNALSRDSTCKQYDKVIHVDEIKLVFTCFNDQGCLDVNISTKPLSLDKDVVFVEWLYIGSNCGGRWSM